MSLTISLVQTPLHWEDKAANLATFDAALSSLAGRTQVVVLPEMFSTGFSMNAASLAENMDGPTVSWMRDRAAAHRVVITGSLIIHENGQYFNRLIWMLPTGQCGVYDKRHRFAYAGEDNHYTAGSKRFIASVNGWRINLQVCYDLRFPVWARQQFTEEGFEYDVLIYVANWPERRATAWKALLQARAVENQCYVVGVNRTGTDGNGIYHSGDSRVIDPLGEILYERAHDTDVFTITLDRSHLDTVREKLPFWKDSDEFQLLL
jgi:omega-amidase